jgi:hypothetical protein
MRRHPAEPRIDITVTTDSGQVHRITTATLAKALERGERYLKAAVAWRQEFERHLAPLCDGPEYEGEREMRFGQLINRFQVPEAVWFPTEGFSEAEKTDVTCLLVEWLNGNLDDFGEFYTCLDEEKDLDPTYILFGVPIRELSVEAQETLRGVGEQWGCWRKGVLAI